MSWDADLISPIGGVTIAEWNYTHNTNQMIEAVIDHDALAALDRTWWSVLNPDTGMGKASWWRLLHGSTGAQSLHLLDQIITGLEADPARFEAMNPENGWGSYATLLDVLRAMRDKAAKEPDAVWNTSG